MHLHAWLFFYCHVQDSGGVICCRVSGSSTKWTIRWAQRPVISRVRTPLIAVITLTNPIDFHPFIGATHVTHSMYNDRLGGPPCTVLCFHSLISMPEGLTILRGRPMKKREMTGRPSDPIHLGFPVPFFLKGQKLAVSFEHFCWIPLFEQILCSFISRGLAVNPWIFGGFRVGQTESRTFL